MESFNLTNSVIKGNSPHGILFKTDEISIFIAWSHLLHVNLFYAGNGSLIFNFSSHLITVRGDKDILEYALTCLSQGSLAGFKSSNELKIGVDEKV